MSGITGLSVLRNKEGEIEIVQVLDSDGMKRSMRAAEYVAAGVQPPISSLQAPKVSPAIDALHRWSAGIQEPTAGQLDTMHRFGFIESDGAGSWRITASGEMAIQENRHLL